MKYFSRFFFSLRYPSLYRSEPLFAYLPSSGESEININHNSIMFIIISPRVLAIEVNVASQSLIDLISHP